MVITTSLDIDRDSEEQGIGSIPEIKNPFVAGIVDGDCSSAEADSRVGSTQ
jgi:hypothetical protein